MHTLRQLEKQQVGLRLPKYLVDELDEFTKDYSLNRTDIIVEAVKSYVTEQKAKIFYADFEDSVKELSLTLNTPKQKDDLKSLDELINELENS